MTSNLLPRIAWQRHTNPKLPGGVREICSAAASRSTLVNIATELGCRVRLDLEAA